MFNIWKPFPKYKPKENDIIGITESVVARAEGRYVTLDDIIKDKVDFIKMDIDELSVAPASILAVRKAICESE